MDPTDYSNNRRTCLKTPTFKYSYKGMTYHYNTGWASDINFKEGNKKIIRINPNKPNKPYVTFGGPSIVYLVFTCAFLLLGIGFLILL